jgi:hypothetical protein
LTTDTPAVQNWSGVAIIFYIYYPKTA